MRALFLALVTTLIMLPVTAQQNPWTLYQTQSGVQIYYQQMDCITDAAPAQVGYLIKVVNTTGSRCTVEWDLSVWYNNEKLSHDVADGENHAIITLEANGTVQGSCENPFGNLYIFKDFITYVSPTKLTRFELENITVSKN